MFTKEAILRSLSREQLIKIAASAALSLKSINPSAKPRPPTDKSTKSMPSVSGAFKNKPDSLESLSGQKVNPNSIKTDKGVSTLSTRIPKIPGTK